MPTSLPNELLFEILTFLHPNPSFSATLTDSRINPLHILLVSSDFYNAYTQIIYSNMVFTRISQLIRFLEIFREREALPRIPHPIRNVTFDVCNDLKLNLYTHIRDFFILCADTKAGGCQVDRLGRAVFDSLKLRFHTHAGDESLHMIYEALSLVNPRSFTWVGPDPPHHFSAAIVPGALSHLLKALQTQSNLTSLTLSHVKFPDNGEILHLPCFPSLKVLNLSQVIFLQPDIMASFILNNLNNGSQLETVHLIDAYQQSIWGPRLRRSHIEGAAQSRVRDAHACDDGVISSSQIEATSNEVLSKIRQIVVCRGEFERIIGGDRVLRDSLLV